jgi:hypothetical protein
MNTAKHTPGPWKITKVMELRKATHYAVKHNDGTGSFSTEVVAQCEKEANARLIAAAPDLLAAANAGLFLADTLANLQGNQEAAKIASVLRAAITKATGQQ